MSSNGRRLHQRGSVGQAEVRGRVYLSEWNDDIATAIFSAGKADVAVGGKHPAHGVAAAEGRPEGAVHHRVQLLLSWQPEEGSEELVLCSGFKVPGDRRGKIKKRWKGKQAGD